MNINELVGLSKERTLIFDLDDTIFPEKEFLFLRYREVVDAFSLPEECYFFLRDYYLNSGRKGLFQSLIEEFNLELSVGDLLFYFRSVFLEKYSIECCDWFERFTCFLPSDFELNIITNGNPLQQQAKIKSLSSISSFKKCNVVYASLYGGKPNKVCFDRLSDLTEIKKPLYIGDSVSDRDFCINSGIEFLDVALIQEFD